MSATPVVRWGMKTLVGILSAQLVNELRLAGHADLVDGGIAFGSQYIFDRKSPPRVVFVPASSAFTGPTYGTESIGTPRPVAPIAQDLATDLFTFDVHVWGAANPPDPDGGDFDDARFLIHQVIRVCQPRLYSSAIKPMRVIYDQTPPSTLGSHATMQLQFATPVIDSLELYLPPGTTGNATIENEAAEVAETIIFPPTGS
jgi:hypothetical protein